MSWTKSSFCSGGSCVETQFVSASACTGGSCVEVGHADGSVLMRDGKLGDASPVISIPAADWPAFLELVGSMS